MENSTTCKYKTITDIQKSFGIYHYVAESSCCAKIYRNRNTHFGWANRGSFSFLRASAMLKHVIDIGWTSVRLSVTRWYGIKTAERLVMISSPHDSPFILVLCIPRSSRNSDGVTPCRGAKQRWGMIKPAIFQKHGASINRSINYNVLST